MSALGASTLTIRGADQEETYKLTRSIGMRNLRERPEPLTIKFSAPEYEGDDEDPSSLSYAADKNDLPRVNFLLEQGALVNGRRGTGSPLFGARTGHMASLLLKHKATLDVVSEVPMLDKISGERLIGWATRPGQNPGYLLVLAQAKGDVNAVDAHGVPPLARLIQRAQQHLDCPDFNKKAEYLMQCGARVDAFMPPSYGNGVRITCAQYLSRELARTYPDRSSIRTRLPRQISVHACLRVLQKTFSEHCDWLRNTRDESVCCLSGIIAKYTSLPRPLLSVILGYLFVPPIHYHENGEQDDFFQRQDDTIVGASDFVKLVEL